MTSDRLYSPALSAAERSGNTPVCRERRRQRQHMRLLLFAISAVLFSALTAEASDKTPDNDPAAAGENLHVYRPGLRNTFSENQLSEKELTLLLTSLQEKTGFSDMRFDAHGFLAIGDRTQFAGGSAAARELMQAAVDGPKSINLQSLNRSTEVVFARLEPSVIYYHWPTRRKVDVQVISIDFADFRYLRGDREVLAAFDTGFAILHELCHAVLELRDPAPGENTAGDCEAFVNRIRRELDLPERQSYVAETWQNQASATGLRSRTAELLFLETAQENPDQKARTRRFYLQWDARLVGRGAGRNQPVKILAGAGQTATDAP